MKMLQKQSGEAASIRSFVMSCCRGHHQKQEVTVSTKCLATLYRSRVWKKGWKSEIVKCVPSHYFY